MINRLLVILLLVVGWSGIYAQDVSKAFDFSKGISFKGGINISTDFYSVSGIDARRSPFSYVLSGSPTITVGEYSFPFSFTIRDQRFSYSRPSFNRVGFSPEYKWIKLHIGQRTMNFSPYTFAGRTFNGLGVELNPGKFRFSAVRGKVRNLFAQRDTITYGAELLPSYERKVEGFKIGFGSQKSFLDLIYFKAEDDLNDDDVESFELDPIENVAIGLHGKVRLFKRISFELNAAASALSDNTNSSEIVIDHPVAETVDKVFTIRQSTRVSAAGDAALMVKLKKISLGVKYKRVEPYYQSFGVPFMQNDYHSMTFLSRLGLLKNKIRLSGQIGLQEDNLQNVRAIGTQRIIGNASAQIFISKKLNLGLRYSNFTRESTPGLVELNDTLRYVLVSQQTGITATYSTKSEDNSSNFTFYANRQSIEDRSVVSRLQGDIGAFTTGLSYGFRQKTTGLSIRPTVNYNRYPVGDDIQERYGGGLRLSRKFLEDKLRVNLSSTYNINDLNKFKTGSVWSNRLGLNGRINDIHNVNLSLSLIKRASLVRPDFTELRTSLGYGYIF